MRVQFKPKIREKIKEICSRGLGWAKIDHWWYSIKMLEIAYFEVKINVIDDDSYEVLTPLHMRGCRLPKIHTEPYKFELDETLFEWNE